MQKLTTHSKSSLFLMEMILSILILALTCTACVRIFAAAKTQRQEAREFNHIQELTTSVGEVLEGWDGQCSSFTQIFGDPGNLSSSDASKNSSNSHSTSSCLLKYYYGSNWETVTEDSAKYIMTIELDTSETEKKADINFYNSRQKNLYHLTVTFPFTSERMNDYE